MNIPKRYLVLPQHIVLKKTRKAKGEKLQTVEYFWDPEEFTLSSHDCYSMPDTSEKEHEVNLPTLVTKQTKSGHKTQVYRKKFNNCVDLQLECLDRMEKKIREGFYYFTRESSRKQSSHMERSTLNVSKLRKMLQSYKLKKQQQVTQLMSSYKKKSFLQTGIPRVSCPAKYKALIEKKIGCPASSKPKRICGTKRTRSHSAHDNLNTPVASNKPKLVSPPKRRRIAHTTRITISTPNGTCRTRRKLIFDEMIEDDDDDMQLEKQSTNVFEPHTFGFADFLCDDTFSPASSQDFVENFTTSQPTNTNTISTIAQERESLVKQIECLKKQKCDLEIEIEKLRNSLNIEKQDFTAQLQEIKSKQQQLESRTEEQNNIAHSLKEREQHLEQRLQQICNKEKELGELEATLTKQREQLNMDIENIHNQDSIRIEKMQQQSNQIEQSKVEISRLANENKSLGEQVQQLTAENHRLLTSLQQIKSRSEEDAVSLREKLQDLAAKEAQFQCEQDKWTTECKSQQQAIGNQQALNEERKRELILKEQMLEEKALYFKKKETDMMQLQERCNEKELEIQKQREAIAREQESMQKEKMQLQNMMQSLENEKSKISKEMSNLETQKTSLDQERKQWNEKQGQESEIIEQNKRGFELYISNAKSEMEQKIARYEKDCAILQKKKEEIENREQMLAHNLSQLQNKESQVRQQETELTVKRSEMDKEREEYVSQCEKIRAKLQESEDKHQHAVSMYNHHIQLLKDKLVGARNGRKKAVDMRKKLMQDLEQLLSAMRECDTSYLSSSQETQTPTPSFNNLIFA